MKGHVLFRTYTNPARLKLLAISIVCLLSLAIIIYFIPPNTLLIGIAFILLFFFCYFLSAFILHNRRRNLLITGGTVTYFLLRFVELRHPLYLLLLIALLISLELYFKKD